ncbi:putative RNA-directed DNA polymerase [Tanacetum coccineum]
MTNVVDISDLNITFGHPNGTIANINHVGNLKLTNNVVLFDVLFIPEYTVSLLSVNKMIKDSKLHVGFNEHDCVIQDLKKENVLGTGSESGGLYMFDFDCDLIHLDLWGPYRVTYREGYGYFLTIVDDFSRVVWVYLIKSKDEVFGYFVDFVNLISNQFLKKVKIIRSDNGTEFINNKMDVFLRDKGIVHQTSCAYTPQQNGIAERKHRHLLNVARSLLFQGGIPLCYWTDCVLTATYLINRLPSSVLAGKSPFSMLYGREPSLSHLRCFGCLCFSSILNNSDKFSSKSEKCILIGYSSSKKAYKLLSLENRSYIFSRDVKFYETIFPYKMKSNDKSSDIVINNEVNTKNFFDMFESGHQNISSPNDDGEGPSGDAGEVIMDHQSTDTAEEQPFDDDVHTASPMDDNPISEGNVPCVQNVPTYNSSNRTDDDNPVCVNSRRSSRVSKLPEKLNDYVLDKKVKYGLNKYANHTKLSANNSCFISNLNKTVEPTCYDEAVKDINWVQAMNNEMEALYLNNTWILTELPINRKAIGSKWVYKIKYKSDGEVERYKARVVAKGFGQKEGVDYEEIFSLVPTYALLLQSHFEAALRVLRYLKSASGAGIIYTKSATISISAYVDSDWAKCKMTRRSVSGYCVFVCGGLVSWKSKKQVTLSRSSAEAEYRSMASAMCEVIWIVKVLKDLNFSSNIHVVLIYDNSFAIQIAANHLKSNGVGFNYSMLFVAAIREEPGGLFGGGGFGGLQPQRSDPSILLVRLLLFLLKITIYGSGLLIVSVYAPSMPPLLSLPLSVACDDSDGCVTGA